jgi:hypothetical protein
MSFALVTLAGNDAVGEAFTVWAYRHSAMVLGTLVLLIYFAALVLQRQVSLSGDLFGRPLVPAKAGPSGSQKHIFARNLDSRCRGNERNSIPVVIGLVRPVHRNADIV